MLPDDVTKEIDPIEGETVQERNGYIAYNERLETYIVPIVFGIIFLVGVVGNGSLMFILCRHKSMRSAPNTLIFNLALGDILVLVCSVPFTSTIYTFESWPYGEFVCKASEFAKASITSFNGRHFMVFKKCVIYSQPRITTGYIGGSIRFHAHGPQL